MNWNTPAEFFAMGGYGTYVWGSFIVTGLCVVVEPLLLRGRRRVAMANAQRDNASQEESHYEKSA